MRYAASYLICKLSGRFDRSLYNDSEIHHMPVGQIHELLRGALASKMDCELGNSVAGAI